jgi:hypothetical protein
VFRLSVIVMLISAVENFFLTAELQPRSNSYQQARHVEATGDKERDRVGSQIGGGV